MIKNLFILVIIVKICLIKADKLLQVFSLNRHGYRLSTRGEYLLQPMGMAMSYIVGFNSAKSYKDKF